MRASVNPACDIPTLSWSLSLLTGSCEEERYRTHTVSHHTCFVSVFMIYRYCYLYQGKPKTSHLHSLALELDEERFMVGLATSVYAQLPRGLQVVAHLMSYAVGLWDSSLDIVETKCYSNVFNYVTWV